MDRTGTLLLYGIGAHDPLMPPTDSMVYVKGQNKEVKRSPGSEGTLTKGDAVGPSRIANSFSVKGSRGTRYVLSGTSSRIMTGNPIAAAGEPKLSQLVLDGWAK